MLGSVGCGDPDPGPPNVLLISIDTLRADHVGAYGYRRDTTPNIDRLAAEGVAFTSVASTTSWTLPAHAAMLSGLFDFEHGVVTPGRRIRPEVTTLAESFQRAGYRTLGLYSGPFLHPDFGFAQGFEEYVDCTSYDLGEAVVGRGAPADQRLNSFHRRSHSAVTNPIVLREARRRVGDLAAGRGRFFLFVHFFDVHYDFIPPAPFDRAFFPEYDGDVTSVDFMRNKRINPDMPADDLKRILALYDGEIRFTDDTVGRLLAMMSDHDLLTNTIVVVTSDHGEEFFEHGGKGHRRTLYEETIRVPLIIWYPPRIDPGRVDEMVRLIDLHPTLLEMCEVPWRDSTEAAGASAFVPRYARSLLPMMQSGAASEREPRPSISELSTPKARLVSIRVGHDKLIVDRKAESVELFDLSSDPGERHPVTRHPDDPDVRRLAGVLDALRSEKGRGTLQDVEIELDARVEQQLRELGYID